MKKQLLYRLWEVFFLITLWGCIEVEEFDNTPKGNFDALWKIMDEQYCFFEYKDVDWAEIYSLYSSRISDQMSEESLFMVLNEMLQELKDGHVNLSSPFDVGRYWKWFEEYPSNFYPSIKDNYLGTNYMIAGGVRYKILEDNIGYMYYGDFSSGLGEANLDYIINKLAICQGIIIDVRDNGGGLLSNADKMANRFVNEKTLVGYIQHKVGKKHHDFSEPYPRYIEPNGRLRYQKPVVVLTNRSCYSSTNDFVNSMKTCPNVTIIGDRTGGGSGLPFSSEIPNGWSVRFSACPMYNAQMEHLEFGIDPDLFVHLREEDINNGIDTIIEAARTFIKTTN
jgi:Periplasmic protease